MWAPHSAVERFMIYIYIYIYIEGKYCGRHSVCAPQSASGGGGAGEASESTGLKYGADRKICLQHVAREGRFACDRYGGAVRRLGTVYRKGSSDDCGDQRERERKGQRQRDRQRGKGGGGGVIE